MDDIVRKPPARLRPNPRYDAERLDELRRKYAAEPEPNEEWQDIAADDAGVPRFGEI